MSQRINERTLSLLPPFLAARAALLTSVSICRKSAISSKESCQAAQPSRLHLQYRRARFDPWDEKIPWRRKWQPTPVFLPGNPMDRRACWATSPWGCKKSDTSWAAERTYEPMQNYSTPSSVGKRPTSQLYLDHLTQGSTNRHYIMSNWLSKTCAVWSGIQFWNMAEF